MFIKYKMGVTMLKEPDYLYVNFKFIVKIRYKGLKYILIRN